MFKNRIGIEISDLDLKIAKLSYHRRTRIIARSCSIGLQQYLVDDSKHKYSLLLNAYQIISRKEKRLSKIYYRGYSTE
jgi:hypothetical protein